MTKIQDIHPTICHSMEMTVKILQNAILYRRREIADMEACIAACQVVAGDEAQPHPETEPEELSAIIKESELTEQRTRRLASFRQAAKDGNGGIE